MTLLAVRSLPIVLLSYVALLLTVANAEITIQGFVSDASIVPEDCTPNVDAMITAAYEGCVNSGSNGAYSGITMRHNTEDVDEGNAGNGGGNRKLSLDQERMVEEHRRLQTCPPDCLYPTCPQCQVCQLLPSCLTWYESRWPDGTSACSHVCTNRRLEGFEDVTSLQAMGGNENPRRLTGEEASIAAQCTKDIKSVTKDLNDDGNFCHGNANALDLTVWIY